MTNIEQQPTRTVQQSDLVTGTSIRVGLAYRMGAVFGQGSMQPDEWTGQIVTLIEETPHAGWLCETSRGVVVHFTRSRLATCEVPI